MVEVRLDGTRQEVEDPTALRDEVCLELLKLACEVGHEAI
jgi:hypothetical protein